MTHPLRFVKLTLAIVGAVLLLWNVGDRVAMPDVRPFRSLRWWFPWPHEDEFRTHRSFRVEQAGRLLIWMCAVLMAGDMLREIL